MLFIVVPLTKTLYMTPKVFLFAYQLPLSRDAQTHAEGCLAVVYSEPRNIWNPGMLETWHIQNFSIFRTLVYSEPWHIWSPGIFRTLVYTEPWHI